jgi:RHS repeat-associated protein
VTNSTDTIADERNFDAWGKNRNPTDWTYANIPVSSLSWMTRGYTGHEHLTQFGLINMNGRLYDPILGRMLSPDNYTQGGSQGYNRYSYAMNNPLKYTDPDGQNPILGILIGAGIGGAVNVYTHWGQIKNGWDFAKAFGVGAVAGALAGLTGGAAATGFGLGSTGIASGLVAGGFGAAFSSPLQAAGNAIFFGDQYSGKEFAKNIILGAIAGGIIGGIAAGIRGENLWWGNTIRPPVPMVSTPPQKIDYHSSTGAKQTRPLSEWGVWCDGEGEKFTVHAKRWELIPENEVFDILGGTPTHAVDRSPDVLHHIFRNSPGHINPSSIKTQDRFLRLFESIANNPANERLDAITANILPRPAVIAGAQAFTETFRNGHQVWVFSRFGRIYDAGINLIPK